MRKILILLLAVVWVFSSVVRADVPHNLQVKLILKILSMDRNFSRFGDPIKIGTSSDGFLKALSASSSLKIKGKSFVVEKMSSPDDVSKYNIVYVGKEWASQYAAASTKAVANKSLMFCETEDGVLSGGGAISFKVVGGKPKIVINLGNVKSQGTDFPAGFLKITVVVGSMD
jgi:YfiR/HmsC-like